MTTVTSRAFVESVRRMVGVPWRHQGRTYSGVDCIGLIVVAYAQVGVDVAALCGIEDRRNYSRTPDPELVAMVQRSCSPAPTLGDARLAVFQFTDDPYPRHFGVLTSEGTVIHAHAPRGMVVEHGYRQQWLRWTHSVWFLPGVTYDV